MQVGRVWRGDIWGFALRERKLQGVDCEGICGTVGLRLGDVREAIGNIERRAVRYPDGDAVQGPGRGARGKRKSAGSGSPSEIGHPNLPSSAAERTAAAAIRLVLGLTSTWRQSW
eukprot:CAMPEP_0173471162 /NCGR_PEP_ID=MMETSP1357-20121228/78252_1 /TAXON_ID=77926 /ORGANISM="Hemiselmis rufescens, Strain PCC563" /LENGTH=114 /DNA_ID=CAMNT_0014439465 /DNA_START=981 /DNA_END=1322 /DNA_ORIENTATION=-